MATSLRVLSWCIVTILLTLTLETRAVARSGAGVTGSRIVTLSVKAAFDQGDKRFRYFSYWTGKLACQAIRPKSNSGSLELCFPIGLGETPSSLTVHWTTVSQNKKSKSSGPLYINLVDPDADPSDVQAWTLFKKTKDPLLKIRLVASTGKENEYTNEDEAEGTIVTWVTSKKGTSCLALAVMKIPERSILLRFVQDPKGVMAMDLNIQSMRLTEFEDDTWTQIIESGNGNISLPGDPSDAECRSFVARQDVAVDEDRDNLAELRNIALQSYRAGEIGASEMLKIVGTMDATRVSRTAADPGQTAMNTMQSYRLLSTLTKEGKIKQQDPATVFELSKKAFARTSPAAGSFGRRIPPPAPAAAGPEVTYYVRQSGSVDAPDGSSNRPFRSISAAYEAAKAIDSRKVALVVNGGYYDEPLNLDRNTSMRSMPGTRPIIASTIVCTRALHLEITGFSLMGAPSPGALQVLVPGSSVSLMDVEIREAHRYGIYQRGGDIELRAVTIRDTRREAGQAEYGTGVLLQGGVQATFSSVTLQDNESSGVMLRGTDSYLCGSEINLQGNKIHTGFYTEAIRDGGLATGAFLVSDHAVADLSGLTILDNEFVGLGVYGNAVVNVDYATVTTSRGIRARGADGSEGDFGGFGIRASAGGHLTMQSFLISQCSLAGVAVHSLGEIDLHIGDVSLNLIGAHVMGGFDFSRLMDRVRFIDNERNLDTDGLPLPDSRPGIPD